MVKIVVSAWVIWVINITLMETTVPEGSIKHWKISR